MKTEFSLEMDISSPGMLESVRRRDTPAIERLVRAYTGPLHRAAMGMGFDREAAEELAQDTFITFYDKAPGFEGRSSFWTYLYAILYRKGMEKRREYAKMRKHDPIDDVMADRFDASGHWAKPPLGPEAFVLAAETGEFLRLCLEVLPLPQKTAFLLREVDDLSGKEICNVLEVSATNLGVLLYRARNRLRECLERKYGGEK